MLTRFPIEVMFRHGWRPSRYNVVIHSIDSKAEQYKVCGRNGFILMESNRPVFAGRGLRHRRPEFKLLQGKLAETIYLDKIAEAIWLHFQNEQRRK